MKSTQAMTMPMPTAVRRSTKTVTRNTTMSTTASARGILGRSLKPRKSMMPHPTVIRIPARTDRGTYFTTEPRPSMMASSSSACTMPLSCVRPPLLTLTTVRMVAPAPGRPQKRPAMALPIPCPINSRLLLCLVLVILSATTEVSSVSMEPRPASVRPGIRAATTMSPHGKPARLTLSLAKNGMGKPDGISPMVGTPSILINRETTVITMRATSVDGTFLVRRGKR